MATKYWVNIDGIQSGPISRDELANIDFNPEVTYVWHEELDDWQRIDHLSEFADIVAAKQKAAAQHSEHSESAESAEQSEHSESSVTPPPVPVMPVEDSESAESSEHSEYSESSATPPPVPQPPMPQPPELQPAMPQPQVPQPPMPQPPVAPEAEAPTNLVWAVIATVMCCQITGVIAIVYGAMTSSANSAGNYEKARRYSDIAQIWVMVSIVLGLIYMPIALLMMML